MASGTINGTTGNDYIDAKIEWSSTANFNDNSSSVTAALYYKRNNTGFTTSGTGTFTIEINGKTKTVTTSVSITEDKWVKVVELTTTVSHGSDGRKSVTIAASGKIPDATLTYTSVYGSATLDVIAKAATIDKLYCSTSYFNGDVTFWWTPQNTNLYHECIVELKLSDGSYSTPMNRMRLGGGGTGTVGISRDETTSLSLALIYNNIPNTEVKGTLRFTIFTYSDSAYSKKVGGYSKNITLSMPEDDSTRPTATMTLSSVNSLDSPFNTLYIQGKSKVKADFANGKGKYGASIVSYKMTVGSTSYETPYTSDYLTTTGAITVKGTVTDSRGFSRTYTQTITVLEYSSPRILPKSDESSIICKRCDKDGNIADSGTYLKIKAKRSYSKLTSEGVQKNFCSIQYRYRATGASWSSWETILDRTATSDDIETGALLGTFDVASSYSVQIRSIDDIGEANTTAQTISTEKVYMHRAGSKNSFSLGKRVEENNTFDVAKDITAIFRGKVKFPGEAWLKLDLNSGINESEVETGRYGGTGAYYRVCSGEKHICITFNVSFTTSSSTVRVVDRYKLDTTEYQIPEEYRPSHDVYALCPVGFSDDSRGIATVSVAPSGRVNVYAVHKLPGATLSNGDIVKWIDGYIDYWT
jgi:hypothetical protein